MRRSGPSCLPMSAEDEFVDAGWAPEPHPVSVQSVEFHDNGVTIAYVEEGDVAPGAMLGKTIIIHRPLLNKEEWEDIMGTLRDWLDIALIAIRHHRNT